LDNPLVLRDGPVVPLFLDVLLGSLERLLAIDLLHVRFSPGSEGVASERDACRCLSEVLNPRGYRWFGQGAEAHSRALRGAFFPATTRQFRAHPERTPTVLVCEPRRTPTSGRRPKARSVHGKPPKECQDRESPTQATAHAQPSRHHCRTEPYCGQSTAHSVRREPRPVRADRRQAAAEIGESAVHGLVQRAWRL